MVTRTIAHFGFVAFLVLVCGAPTQAADKINLAVIGSAVDTPFYIARDKGYFKDEDLEVNFINFDGKGDRAACHRRPGYRQRCPVGLVLQRNGAGRIDPDCRRQGSHGSRLLLSERLCAQRFDRRRERSGASRTSKARGWDLLLPVLPRCPWSTKQP